MPRCRGGDACGGLGDGVVRAPVAKRVANLLALSLADLSELLQAYGVEPSFEA